MEFLQKIAGRVLTGVIGLAVIAGGISWFNMSPGDREAVLRGIGHYLAWFAVVLLLPGATFFLIKWAAGFDSNSAGAVLVGGYTLIETLLLLWFKSWHITGPAMWIAFVAAVLIAALYNILICDWIAEKLE